MASTGALALSGLVLVVAAVLLVHGLMQLHVVMGATADLALPADTRTVGALLQAGAGLLLMVAVGLFLLASQARLRASALEAEARAGRAMADYGTEGMAVFDADRRLQTWNRRYERESAVLGRLPARGMSVDEVIGVASDSRFLGERQAPELQAWSAVETSDAEPLELRAGARWLRIVRRAGPAGTTVLRIADVTVERGLAEDLARLAEVTEHADDLVAITNDAGVIRLANARFRGAVGREDVVGQALATQLPAGFFNRILAEPAHRAATGETVRLRQWLPFAALGDRYLDIRIRAVAGGTERSLVYLFRDITDTLDAGTRSREAGAHLAMARTVNQADDATERYLSEQSDILTSLSGYAELARRHGATDPTLAGYLSEVEAGARRAHDSIESLMDTLEGLRRRPEALDLQARSRLWRRLLTTSLPEGARLSLDIPGDLPSVHVEAFALDHVVTELALRVSLAGAPGVQVKASPLPVDKASCAVCQSPTGGQWVRLVVGAGADLGPDAAADATPDDGPLARISDHVMRVVHRQGAHLQALRAPGDVPAFELHLPVRDTAAPMPD